MSQRITHPIQNERCRYFPSPLNPRSPLLRPQNPSHHLARLDHVHLVPEAAVAEEAAGAVFLLLEEGGDLVADLLEAVDPFRSWRGGGRPSRRGPRSPASRG